MFIKMNPDKITCLVIGDPHFKVGNVKETDEMCEAIYRVVREKKPDFIVVLGDILDRHESIHAAPLCRSVDFLTKLEKLCGEYGTWVLIGNHDMPNNRQFLTQIHPFTALKHLSEEQKLCIADTTINRTWKNNKFKFVFVPYVPPGRFVDALNTLADGTWTDATAIFAHQEFFGCKMGAIISNEGDKWPLGNPYVISGHIHDYQEPQTNILYTGTPMQHAFGDQHHKTISYFEFNVKDGKVERKHERIDLHLRKKHLEHITCTEVSGHIPRNNCDLKIVITGTSPEIKTILQHPNIEIWKKAGHKIVYKDNATAGEFSAIASAPRIQITFTQALQNAIANDTQLHLVYQKAFGQMPNNQIKEEVKPLPMLKLNIQPR